MDDGVRQVYETIAMAERGPGVHIMTGPIFVHDAEPGDTLEVRILGLEPRLPYGSNIAAWWGGLYDEFRKERITIYRIDADAGWARAAFAFDYRSSPRYDAPGAIIVPDRGSREPALANVTVPLRPHLGVMGVAPKEAGRINSIPPGDFGGNLDNWRIGPGAIMYYPVFNSGALLFAGDPHVAEGDGELSGTAIEASANVLLQVFVRKDFRADHPILETASHWFTHGFDEDLDLAMRQAALRMLDFLTVRKGLSRDEAYSLMSVAVDFGVTQVVDQRKGIHAALPKNLFGRA
jgi:formamidase